MSAWPAKGEEILETLIARKLIDQAIRAGKVEVTPMEVEDEIERVAQSIAGRVSREVAGDAGERAEDQPCRSMRVTSFTRRSRFESWRRRR